MARLLFQRPRLLLLLIALISVAGLSALSALPRAEDPELAGRNASIFTALPGADAKRVEALVTDVIEDSLVDIEEIKDVFSTSRAGSSSVLLELHDDITDTARVWAQVRDELAELRPLLPQAASAPDLEDFTITAYTRIVALVPEGGGTAVPGAQLGRLAEELADHMRAVRGTREAEVYARAPEELLVDIDAGKLAAQGLSVEDVTAAIRASDAKVDGGILRSPGANLFVKVEGELLGASGLDRLRKLPVRVGADGAVLRVEDIATVAKGVREHHADIALIDGVPGVVVGIRLLDAERIDLWAARAAEALAEFEADLPHGIKMVSIFDQTGYTGERLTALASNFIMAILFVMIVLFFTMGWRSAFLVGASLPLVTFMVLMCMQWFGMPMNQMSIAGLIIALGLLIDNGIVMIDHMSHALREQLERVDRSDKRAALGARIAAIRSAVGHLGIPLIGSTLTTALAFMPIVLMPGASGEFVGAMAKNVVIAITSSLLVALTVLPALSAWFDSLTKSGAPHDAPGFVRRLLSEGFSMPSLSRVFERLVETLITHPVLGISVALFLPLLGFFAAAGLEEQFFPPSDRDHFSLELELAPSATIDQTREMAMEARELLLDQERVTGVHWFLGRSAPKFYYNQIETRKGEANLGSALVMLDSNENSAAVIRELQELLTEAFPSARLLAKQMEQGPPFEAPVELHITGPDLAMLFAIGEELREVIAGLDGVTHTTAKLAAGRPTLRVTVDEEEARRVGLDNTAIAGRIAKGLDGSVGGSLIEGTEELPVRVRIREQDRSDTSGLAALDLPLGMVGGTRSYTPLAALAELRLEPEAAQITHRFGKRSTTVQAFLDAGLLPSRVVTALHAELERREFALPVGYEMKAGGEAAERDEAVGGLLATVGILMILMAASLVMSFNSFRLAGLIGLVGFLAVGLAMLALRIFGYPFGFMAIVGTMGLVGVAINDSIVVLAALNENAKARIGDAKAVVAVTMHASRHVISTTLTTVVGFLPLYLAGGSFWPPVAVTIGGGVLGATQLALTLVPALYLVHAKRLARRAA